MIPEGEFRDQGGPLLRRRPWWFLLILILLVLPSFATPWLLADAPKDSLLEILTECFPVYLLLSAVCAWYAYPARREVAWILVALMILTASALFMI